MDKKRKLLELAEFLEGKHVTCHNDKYVKEFNEFAQIFSEHFPDIVVSRCNLKFLINKVKQIKY